MLGISGLALSITSLVFVILSAIFYSTSNNLSFDFFAIALALFFIDLFIIVPEILNYDP
jgi:FtsH-binding integral membrane protein